MADTYAPESSLMAPDEEDRLQERVRVLEAERDALKAELAQTKEALGEISTACETSDLRVGFCRQGFDAQRKVIETVWAVARRANGAKP